MEDRARIVSIDILRALTMFFMIWVNDFPTLTDIPKWLEHAPPGEDYIGFSDLIFPLFLFVVGLSIPFAIQHRQAIAAGLLSTGKHIIFRTLSLLIIGVYIVNYEVARDDGNTIVFGVYWWCFLMALGVVLVWIDWKKSVVAATWQLPLRGVGILLLLFLAFSYAGGADGEAGMSSHWWGILGLIGWAYLANALAVLVSRSNLPVNIGIFVVFNLLAVLNFAGLLDGAPDFIALFGTIYQGFIPAFTSAGVVTALMLQRLRTEHPHRVVPFLLLFAALSAGYGFVMKPYFWMVYKLGVSVGFSLLAFAAVYWIVELKARSAWAKPISAAGTATLTCYMMPYFVYPLRSVSDFRFPDFMNRGLVGLIVSLLFAYLVVYVADKLERKGLKLRL